jgi:CRP/FNR family transcriptional regulator
LTKPAIELDRVDFLGRLSVANRRRLLLGSTRAVYPAGTLAIRPGGPRVVFLIDSGLARAYWTIPDGRQAAVAFYRPQEIVISNTFLDRPPWTFVQTITDSTLTLLDPDNVRALAEHEVQVAVAMATNLSLRVRDAFRLITVRSLGSIRERLAYDLLTRTSQSQLVAGRLEVRATQTQLADSIGSSREVLSRALRDLRAAGIVETAPGLVRVLNPQQLVAIVSCFVT